jgi:hypothetical protein
VEHDGFKAPFVGGLPRQIHLTIDPPYEVRFIRRTVVPRQIHHTIHPPYGHKSEK